jgi:hypothetical protein
MEQIASALELAAWSRQAFLAPGDVSLTFSSPGKPAAGLIIGVGIELRMAGARKDEWSAAALALASALYAEGITIAGVSAFEGPTPDAIHIIIGSKP